MSQNARTLSSLNTRGHSFIDMDTEEDPLALVETLKILSCPICRAVYKPSSSQCPDAVLEDAFMGVCHFCFRCQRPSCPQCWNPIHHVCASCGEKAHLPFCSPVPALEGLVFAPLTASQTVRELNLSFTCLRNGQLYFPDPEPVSCPEPPQAGSPASSPPTTSGNLPAVQAEQTRRAEPDPVHAYPTWVQEVLGYKPGGVVSAEADSWKNKQGASTIWDAPADASTAPLRAGQTNRSQVSQALPQPPVFVPEADEPERQEEALDGEAVPPFERIENALLIGISALLLVVGLVIALAVSSPTMNTFFLHILHIDIRSEVSYLLQLR